MTFSSIVARIKREEGLSLRLYRDQAGVPTIGYGTNVSSIDEEEAEFLLGHRLERAARDVLSEFPWAAALDPVRFGVLADMAYNLGVARLAQFHTTLAAVAAGEWSAAHDGMLASLWARQVGPRSAALARMMLTGVDPGDPIDPGTSKDAPAPSGTSAHP